MCLEMLLGREKGDYVMRKSVVAVIGIIAVWFLSSCSAGVSQQMDSMYFFTTDVGSDIGLHGCGVSIPIRINPVAGSAASVCLDPLCPESVFECPLGDARMRAVAGNFLFFVKRFLGDSGSQDYPKQLCVYNMVEGSYKTVDTYDNYPIFAGTHGGWLYYFEVTSMDGAPDTGYAAAARLCRIHGASLKIEYLSENAEYHSAYSFTYTNLPQIIGFGEDIILWKYLNAAEDGYEWYVTDLRNKNKRIIHNTDNIRANVQYADGCLFYTEAVDGRTHESGYLSKKQQQENILYSLDIETGDVRMICPYMAQYIIVEDTVYYTVCQDEIEEISWEKDTVYDWYGGQLYAVRTDGTDSRWIGEMEDIHLAYFLDAKRIDGSDYLHFQIYAWNDNDFYKSGKEYALSASTVVFSCASGDYTVIRYD